jgi:hypothetical protein
MIASGLHRKAKRLVGEIAALAVLASVVSIASAQPKDFLRYKITATTDLTSSGGIKDTGTGKNDGTEISLGAESVIVPGHAPGSFAVFLAGDDASAAGTGIDTGTDTTTMGIDGAAFTVMAWLNRGTLKGDNMVFGTNLNGGGDLHLGFRGPVCYVGFWGNDSSGPFFAPFAWHHWAVRYDDTKRTQDIFVDGVLVNSDGGHNAYSGTNELFVGRTFGNNGAYGGAIDDARLFKAALRDDQILAIAQDKAIPP